MTGGLDPILLAGTARCTWCDREAYPVDAVWLTGEQLLATFAQPHGGDCRGPRAWTVIIDITAAAGHAFSHAPRDNGRRARDYYRRHSCRSCGALAYARYCDVCRCQARTTRGCRCANRARPGGFCGVHLPAAGLAGAVTQPERGKTR